MSAVGRRSVLLAVLLVIVLSQGLAIAAEPSYDDLRKAYDYDHNAALNTEMGGELTANGQFVRIVFSSLNDERVPAVIALPNSAQHGDGPYPAVVFGHGLGGSKDDPGYRMAASVIVQAGYAVIMIDYPFHGERAPKEGPTLSDPANLSPEDAGKLLDLMVKGATQTVLDQRRAIDFLCTRPELDKARIGYAGLSLGAILGSVLAGVEDRLACAALVVGGADWGKILSTSVLTSAARTAGAFDPAAAAEKLQGADPKYFAPHIGCPTLLLFGGKDTVVPYDPCGKLLSELVSGDKTVHVYENSGHGLEGQGDQFDAVGRLLAFFKERLHGK